jgi:hypothetical protein
MNGELTLRAPYGNVAHVHQMRRPEVPHAQIDYDRQGAAHDGGVLGGWNFAPPNSMAEFVMQVVCDPRMP